MSVYIIGHKTLRGRRAELQAACLSRAPVHCRLGTRAFFAPKCGKTTYIIGHKTLRGRRAELQAACLSRAPVHCRLGTRAFFAPKCGKTTVLYAQLVWKLGPREAENGPKLSSTMYHLYVITVQYACSSRPSIACRHETWVIRAPKCSPMIVLCALLVRRLGLQEADDGPTLSSTMYHLYVITVQYVIL